MQARNPHSGLQDYDFAAASEADVAAACECARQRQGQWRDLGVEGRCAVLTDFAARLKSHSADLFAALCEDTGRVRETKVELDGLIAMLEHWAQRAPQLLAPVPPEQSGPVSVGRRCDPYALVAVISPWNLPLLLSFIDAVPALAAGCAVVIKPSEITPRFVEPLCALLRQTPWLDDLVQVLLGDAATGDSLVGCADALCFTGSVATGKKLAVRAAECFIPASLELGGKDPAIVLPGADLQKAAPAILFGGVSNAGQSCLGIERVYVHRSEYELFADLLVHHARNLRLNWPDRNVGEIGPIISGKQVDIVREHLHRAGRDGAQMLAGGELEEHGGIWCQPTVLTGAPTTSPILTDETFAPILPLVPFDDEDEAVQLANDSLFGLSAAVFGPQLQAERVAGRLRAGAVSINDACLTMISHRGEKQSYGFSGLGGSRMGDASIRRFYRVQAWLSNEISGPDPWWYPVLQHRPADEISP